MQGNDIDLSALLDEFEEDFDNDDIDEYLEIQRVYEQKFGHIPERLLMPPIVTEEQIKKAMQQCIETGEDNLGELLNIGKDYKNIDKNKLL